ncbi:hypothetical protein [Actinomadura sp. 9N407]|uniref:hypothetical protein n=1 Tax=Actinomadura sp. 9N407 TaxID=3375154 RepID=UPI0037A4CBB3
MTQHGGERSVNIGGNASVSGQISTGDDTVQIQRTEAPVSAAAESLDRVERLLERHAAEIAEVDKARRDLADIRREIEESDPDSERIGGALDRLGRRVAGVAVLTEAVGQLTTTLGLG